MKNENEVVWKKMKIEVVEEEGYLVGGRWGTEAKTEAGCGGWSSVMSSGSDVMWEESIAFCLNRSMRRF